MDIQNKYNLEVFVSERECINTTVFFSSMLIIKWSDIVQRGLSATLLIIMYGYREKEDK